MTFISSVALFGLCASLALCASIPDAGQSPSQPQASAFTNAEQPVAAESSYGSSYAPKYKSSHDSYNNDYATPYVTQSCYGQYPGMFGNADYDCKSYRVCQADGRLDILYCPPYTRFNNYLGVCDWHFKVDSYCNPLYKEEYNSYENKGYGGSSYEKPYEKPAYAAPQYGQDSYAPKYEKSYEKPIYNAGYEAPKYSSNYEAPHHEKGYGSYEAPSYGHRSVYKKY